MAVVAAREAKTWAREVLRGHFVTTTTPFHDDLSIDEQGLRDNVEHLLRLPCTGGLYVNSILGEGIALNVDERRVVAAAIVDQVAGRVPVVVVGSGTILGDVIRQAQDAQEVGADLVMLWPPIFGFRTPEGVGDFIRAVVASVDLPIAVYASGLSEYGFQITIPMLRELAELDQVCAVKEASLSLTKYLQTLDAVGDRLVISCPVEEYWAAARRLAPSTATDVHLGTSRPIHVETEKAPYLTHVREAAESGDDKALEAALARVIALLDQLHIRYIEGGRHNTALTKAISGLRGMAAGKVRPPLTAPPSHQVEEARTLMQQAGLI